MKIDIKVFPDYMSSGFWDKLTGVSCDESEFAHVLPQNLMTGFKYWHWAWEHYSEMWETQIEYAEHNGGNINSRVYIEQFDIDGQEFVNEMNKCQDQYNFVYFQSFNI